MNTKKQDRQFGLWQSPITPQHLAQGLRFSDVAWDANGDLVWLEGRSDRNVLVVQPANSHAWRDLQGLYSARARVGYGGGDFAVGEGQVFFAEAESGRLYRQSLEAGPAVPLTPGFGSAAAPVLSPDGAWLLYIRSYEGQDSLEIVDCDGKFWPQKLVSGNDFYMQPAWHPDGRHMAWISWDHPNMPWDGTRLWMGKLEMVPGSLPVLSERQTIAGGEQVSIFQPAFSPDGQYLAYVSDASGWWQIYIWDLVKKEHIQLTHALAEHGMPGWVQGMRTFGFAPDGSSLFYIRNASAASTLGKVDLRSRQEMDLPLDAGYTSLDQISVSAAGIALIASSGGIPSRVITVPIQSKAGPSQSNTATVIRRSMSEEFTADTYASPEHLSWEGKDGQAVFGIYYPAHSPLFTAPGKPPLILNVHGGPTSQVKNGFNLKAQFFTSRGYAYLDVNYRGSTGYGRDYRNLLLGKWGIYDVQDAMSGAQHLVDTGRADPERLVIMGGSAGGFTVYQAMEDYPEFFCAGICFYGVSNQFALAAETHKFEAHYNDSLLGPLPQAVAIYRERSPINFVDKIRRPIAIFQGEEDRVVPRRQSDEMVEILRRNRVPVVYHVYAGEGHGFRKTETIQHMYQAIEKFLVDYVIYA